MRFRKLGRTNFEVSEMAHGLWGMGSWPDSKDAESRNALQLAVDLGCNFFDTAWAYGDGRSDGFLGETLQRNSNKHLFAASKVPPMNRKWPASPKDAYTDVFPAEHVLRHADMIRKKLQVETIDLLQLHVWDDSWAEHREFQETIKKLKQDGVVRAFGLSLNRWEPANGIKALRTGLVDTVQVIYNVFDQDAEDELFPLCRELNVGVIARVPLDEGSLGGKLTAATQFAEGDWRAGYFNPENLRATVARVERLKAILPDGMTLPELALRFILSNPVVSTVIVGMRKPEHVRANLALSDAGPLDGNLLAELKKHRWERKPAAWSN
ncbi:MAG TPA: aldo/keto reductase [Candidatus Angelobacter sp.]|jgi:aryl-alcohol dehydrogenase-like predicted oxidoreductase|nr:aldo/keto reductase [Candidatus Angelobacter sp.]